jgi:hypothetical protein
MNRGPKYFPPKKPNQHEEQDSTTERPESSGAGSGRPVTPDSENEGDDVKDPKQQLNTHGATDTPRGE